MEENRLFSDAAIAEDPFLNSNNNVAPAPIIKVIVHLD